MEKVYSVPAPKVGKPIMVYHPLRGAVEMIVISQNFAPVPSNNTLCCEYDGEECTVRLQKIDDTYRWAAETL